MTNQIGLKINQGALNAPTDLAALTNPDGERSSGLALVRREGDEDEKDGEIPEEARHVCSRRSLSRRGAHLLSVLEEIRWVPNHDCRPCQTVCPHSVREKSRVKHRIVSHRLIAIGTETDGQTEGRTEADGTLARASERSLAVPFLPGGPRASAPHPAASALRSSSSSPSSAFPSQIHAARVMDVEIGYHLGFGIGMMSGDVKFSNSKFNEIPFFR